MENHNDARGHTKSTRHKRTAKPSRPNTQAPATAQEKVDFASLIGHLGQAPSFGKPKPAKAREKKSAPITKSVVTYTRDELLALRESPMASSLQKDIAKIDGLTKSSRKGSAAFAVPFGAHAIDGNGSRKHTRLSARVDALKQSGASVRGSASPPSSPQQRRRPDGSDAGYGRQDTGGRSYTDRRDARGRSYRQDEEEELPEWARSGPMDVNDTMELHGFADDKRSIEEGLPDFFKTSGAGAGIGGMDILGGLEDDDALGGALEDSLEDSLASTMDAGPAATEADFFSTMATERISDHIAAPSEEDTSATGARSRFFSRDAVAPQDEEDADGNFGERQQRLPPQHSAATVFVQESTSTQLFAPGGAIDPSGSKHADTTEADRTQMQKFFGAAAGGMASAGISQGRGEQGNKPATGDASLPDAIPLQRIADVTDDRAALLKYFGTGGQQPQGATVNTTRIDTGTTKPTKSHQPPRVTSVASTDTIVLPSADPWKRPLAPPPPASATVPAPRDAVPPHGNESEQSSLLNMLGKAGIVSGTAAVGSTTPTPAVAPQSTNIATSVAAANPKSGMSRAFMPTSVIRKMGKKDGRKQPPPATQAPARQQMSSAHKPSASQHVGASVGTAPGGGPAQGGNNPHLPPQHPPPPPPLDPRAPHSYQYQYQGVPPNANYGIPHHAPYGVPAQHPHAYGGAPPSLYAPDSFSGVGLNPAQANIMKLFGIGGAPASST
eukprot:m.635917 g.635917  ORF g.635917 m.635917 type:complete len:726 (-) comp22588_c0_seq3:616-2793(-)